MQNDKRIGLVGSPVRRSRPIVPDPESGRIGAAAGTPVAAGAGPRRIVTPGDPRTRVEQIVDWHTRRIDERVLRPGARLPSIRRFAAEQGVSRFTVVEAFDRLVARGYVSSRRGAGFFVRERQPERRFADARTWAEAPSGSIDVVWLLRNMFRRLPPADMPGGGVLPAQWLDEGLVAGSLRAIGRANAAALLDYGHPQGYLPLRQQLQQRLAEIEIDAAPEQLVTTCGVTQGLDIVAQRFVKPGDVVLVDEPSWFLLFGRYATLGARLVGVPRLADGPDLERLAQLLAEFRPRLYVTTSVLHNPTGSSISAAKAYQVLRLAEASKLTIVEDDVYSDLHPGPSLQPNIRLAALDQLRRVVYLGGFSKTLAANLRVGFIACHRELARELTDLKMLVGLTSPEVGERVVFRVLSEGHYRRHLVRLRERLDRTRPGVLATLEHLGLKAALAPPAGMFVWVDAGLETTPLAGAMLERGFLLSPGSLFMPDQRASTWLRFNVATSSNPRMLAALAEELARARGQAGT